jgi:[FeFe] hydrogenase (group B1/B3)
LEMRPKNGEISRCCVYRDRAMIKYKLMAILGFNIQDEVDELAPLSEYVQKAYQREQVSSSILTVVDEVCSGCVRVNYEVTNLCRGCVGRPCVLNCPKDAISFTDGRAKIDHNTCINCGKCYKACPFHAIIYQPIPCEEACPVSAIGKKPDGTEYIDESKCTSCGKCLIACPFGAIIEKSHIIEIFKAMAQNKKLIALPAPSIIGQFKFEYGKIIGAIKALGFYDVIEVAAGANETAAHEAAEFQERLGHGAPFMTTSCCPAYTQLVDKHAPELKPFVSETRSPMHYTAKMAREKYPDGVIVFVGPCVAKRSEAFFDEYVDYTLSFEELGSLFIASGIFVASSEIIPIDESIKRTGHGFGVVGGVTAAMKAGLPANFQWSNLVIDGIDKAMVKQLKTYANGKSPAQFIEVMTCEGGCVAGPNVISNTKLASKQLADFVNGIKSNGI